MRKYYRNICAFWVTLSAALMIALLFSVTGSKAFIAQYHSTILMQRNPGTMEMTFVHRFTYERFDSEKVFFHIETDSNEVHYAPGQTVLINKNYLEYGMIAYSAFIVLAPLILLVFIVLSMIYFNKWREYENAVNSFQ